jgi:PIN domain nuclease of toxin-antitoxin system
VARAVLDASALVAFFHREKGHEVVAKIIDGGAVVTSTGVAEALATCRRKHHPKNRDELLLIISQLGVSIEPVNEEDAAEMAYFLAASDDAAEKEPRRGRLSLGDAACLAVATRLELPAVMSDATWEVLNVHGVRILPFR